MTMAINQTGRHMLTFGVDDDAIKGNRRTNLRPNGRNPAFSNSDRRIGDYSRWPTGPNSGVKD